MRMIFLLVAMLFLGLPAASQEKAEDKDPDPRTCLATTDAAPAWTATCIRQSAFFADTCAAISIFAWREQLPAGFLARLIWQESHFDPYALSVAGAQGIAQFMPSTARLREVKNSFDPAEALAKSARYLRFLADKYGSLGLAAAAYNGGEGRMTRYVNAGGYLPGETRYYVEIVTGLPVEAWQQDPLPEPDYRLSKTEPFVDACINMAKNELSPRLDRAPSEWRPWGVLLAQNFSQAVAVRSFERVKAAHPKVMSDETLMLLLARNPNFGPRLRHYAMIGRDSRKEAEALCTRLQADGGSCIVRKN
jgi:hypothetical protein